MPYRALLLEDAKFIVIPKYSELSVKKIWPHIQQIDELKLYFPDMKPHQKPERDYMWTVL